MERVGVVAPKPADFIGDLPSRAFRSLTSPLSSHHLLSRQATVLKFHASKSSKVCDAVAEGALPCGTYKRDAIPAAPA
jgi:hypothetical protein